MTIAGLRLKVKFIGQGQRSLSSAYVLVTHLHGRSDLNPRSTTVFLV